MRRAWVAPAVAAALAVPGCGGPAPVGPPPPPPVASGYFVGTTPGRLGVAVDVAGFDPTALAVSRALLGYDRPTALAVVSLVNDGEEPVDVPLVVAVTRSGRQVPMVDVRVLLARIPEARARIARARTPVVRQVPAGGSRMVYLAAVDVLPDEVAGVRVTAGTDVVDLPASRR